MAINLPDIVGKIRIDTSALDKSLKGSTESISGFSNSTKRNLALVGGAMVAAGAVLTREGARIERSNITLRNTVENVGASYKDLKPQIDRAVQTQQKYGHTISDSQGVLAKFTLQLKDPQKAMEALALASDIAAAKNISLGDAAGIVGKAYMGNAKVFKQFGIDIKESKVAVEAGEKATGAYSKAIDNLKVAQLALSDIQARIKAQGFASADDQRALAAAATEVANAQREVGKTAGEVQATQGAASQGSRDLATAMDKVKDSVKGTNDELAGTFTGRLKAVKVEIQDFIGAVGQKLGPAVTGIGTAFATLSGVTTVLDSGLAKLIASGAIKFFTLLKAEIAATSVAAVALKGALIATGVGAALVGVGIAFNKIQESMEKTKNTARSLSEELIKQGGTPVGAINNLSAAHDLAKQRVNQLRSEYSLFGVDLSFLSGRMGHYKAEAEILGQAEEAQRAKRKAASDERRAQLALIEGAVGSEAAATAAAAAKDADALAAAAQAAVAFRDSVKGAFESATSVVQKFGSDTEVTKAQVLQFFKDQVAAARDWSINLQLLSKAGLDQGLLAELAAAGPKAAPLIRALLDAVNTGNLAAINKAQVDLRTILNDTVNGVSAKAPAAGAAGTQVGTSAGDGMAGGLRSRRFAVEQAMRNSTDAVSDAKGTSERKGHEVGREASHGMKRGIDSGQSSVINAAIAVARAAWNAAKRALGISSPSKLFAKTIGLPMAQGMAQGLAKGTGLVTSSMGSLVASAQKEAQGALGFANSVVKAGTSSTVAAPIIAPTPAAGPSITIANLNVTTQDAQGIGPEISRELGWLLSGVSRGRV